jgi:hypothetical protein
MKNKGWNMSMLILFWKAILLMLLFNWGNYPKESILLWHKLSFPSTVQVRLRYQYTVNRDHLSRRSVVLINTL